MKIEVTQEHIDQGRRGSGENCAVALAMSHLIRPVVDGEFAHFGPWQSRTHVELPGDVRAWIHDFDASRRVRPFSFELEVTP